MCPGRKKSSAVVDMSARRFIVLARSTELIPVVMPVGLELKRTREEGGQVYAEKFRVSLNWVSLMSYISHRFIRNAIRRMH